MAALDLALAEMDKLVSGRDHGAAVAGDKRAQLVIESRRKMIEQIGKMLEALPHDDKFKAKPDLAKQFSTKLTGMRQSLAALQAKWRAVTILENFEDYSAETTGVIRNCVEFVSWAKSARAAA